MLKNNLCLKLRKNQKNMEYAFSKKVKNAKKCVLVLLRTILKFSFFVNKKVFLVNLKNNFISYDLCDLYLRT